MIFPKFYYIKFVLEKNILGIKIQIVKFLD
jgi:hypothetical protein